MTNPVTIRGTTYPSQRAAARALGVCEGTIYAALERGDVDNVGTYQRGAKPKPCVYRGKEYPSRIAAARAHGVSGSSVSSMIKRERQRAEARA